MAATTSEPADELDVNTSLVELAQASLAVPQPQSAIAVVPIDPALMDEPEPGEAMRAELQRDIIHSPGAAPEMSLYHPDVDDQSLAALAEATDGLEHVGGYEETLDQAQMRASKHGYEQHEQQDELMMHQHQPMASSSTTNSSRRINKNAAPGTAEGILHYGPPPEIGYLPSPDSAHPLRFQLDNEDQFQDWLTNQKELVKWRLVRDFDVAAKQEKDRERAREKRDKARMDKAKELGVDYVHKPIRSYKRPQNPSMPAAERERNYQCPSHGNYTAVPSEKRKRYRAPTITCGCQANIKVSSFPSGLLEVNWFWRHEGHIPGEKRTEVSPAPPTKKQRNVASKKPKTPATASGSTPVENGLSVSPPPSSTGGKAKDEPAAGTLASIMGEGQGPSRLAYVNRHDVPESAVRGS